MPRLVDSLLRPARRPQEPVTVDLVRVLLVGSAVWAVALVVSALLATAGRIDWIATWVCGCGLVIGGGASLWERRRPVARPAAQVRPADEAAAPGSSVDGGN